MLTVQELAVLFDMLANSRVENYAAAIRVQPVVNKLVGVHQAVVSGRRLDTLSADEAAAVDALRKPAKNTPAA